MSKFLYIIKSKFLKIFGSIKYFKFPFFFIYDPDEYLIDGIKTRKIMKSIRTGDLIMRRYRHYLDGIFIPGKYSHTGIYVGEGKVIHAISKGVCEIDLLDFTRCDGIIILRPRKGQKKAVEIAKEFVKGNIPYDYDFSEGKNALYCHELGAACYTNLRMEKKIPKIFFGLIHGHDTKWLCDSFLTSPDFRKILEY